VEIPLAVFSIENETYAIHLDHLVEILLDFRIDPLPHIGGHFVGTISFPLGDGVNIPVVDLASLFGLPSPPNKRHLLVVQENGSRAGLLIDSPTEIVRVKPEAISPPPAIFSESERCYVTAVARLGSRLASLIRPMRAVETLSGLTSRAEHGG